MSSKERLPINAQNGLEPSSEGVQLQLDRILASLEFKATRQQRAMLEYVVSETLAGRVHDIKGYTVATRVFGRRENFDQATDPIVSIQANKLRRALERYYLVAGQTDPVRITIPLGTYVPTFQLQEGIEADEILQGDESVAYRPDDAWPTLLIRPFQNLTGDPEQSWMITGFAVELATELTRYQEIRVLMLNTDGEAGQTPRVAARFALEGSVRKDVSGIKVAIQLIDLSTNLQIWCDTFCSGSDDARLILFQEEVAKAVLAKIVGEFGVISRTVSFESRRTPPSELKTFEAILQYNEFNTKFTPETFLRAFKSLSVATAREAGRGLVWSMLGRLYGNNYSLELFDLDTPLEEAVAFAQKGAALEPENQRVRGILAYVLLLTNNLSAGIAEVDRAIALNPNSLIFMDGFGYLLTLLGDWQRGPALICEAIKRNPFYHVVVHHALWVDWVRREDYQQAYFETLNFRMPTLFWEPLIKAAGFGLLGRIEEGREAVRHLLALKPDFPSRGRVLIGHYIKFEEIVARMLKGLDRVGLSLD